MVNHSKIISKMLEKRRLGEKYDEEINRYDKILEMDSKDINTPNKSLELNPKNVNAWNNKGKMLNKLGKYDEAIECYDNVYTIFDSDTITKLCEKFQISRLNFRNANLINFISKYDYKNMGGEELLNSIEDFFDFTSFTYEYIDSPLYFESDLVIYDDTLSNNQNYALKRLYEIVGYEELNSVFLTLLDKLDFSINDGKDIKFILEYDIKKNYTKFHSVGHNFKSLVKNKIEEKKILSLIDKYIGFYEFSPYFIDKLNEYNLSKDSGILIKNKFIKKLSKNLILDYRIKSDIEISLEKEVIKYELINKYGDATQNEVNIAYNNKKNNEKDYLKKITEDIFSDEEKIESFYVKYENKFGDRDIFDLNLRNPIFTLEERLIGQREYKKKFNKKRRIY